MGDTRPNPVVCMRIFGDTGADEETAPPQSDTSSLSSDDNEKKSKKFNGGPKSRERLRLSMQQKLKAVQTI